MYFWYGALKTHLQIPHMAMVWEPGGCQPFKSGAKTAGWKGRGGSGQKAAFRQAEDAKGGTYQRLSTAGQKGIAYVHGMLRQARRQDWDRGGQKGPGGSKSPPGSTPGAASVRRPDAGQSANFPRCIQPGGPSGAPEEIESDRGLVRRRMRADNRAALQHSSGRPESRTNSAAISQDSPSSCNTPPAGPSRAPGFWRAADQIISNRLDYCHAIVARD